VLPTALQIDEQDAWHGAWTQASSPTNCTANLSDGAVTRDERQRTNGAATTTGTYVEEVSTTAGTATTTTSYFVFFGPRKLYNTGPIQIGSNRMSMIVQNQLRS
jgi:hypothetical protein